MFRKKGLYVIVYWQYWSLLADGNHDAFLQEPPSAVLLQPDEICVLRPLLQWCSQFHALDCENQ